MSARANRRDLWILLCCAIVFIAAVTGAVACGLRMGHVQDTSQAAHLRWLIYAHFLLSQLALAAAISLIYAAHRHWRRSYLIVSYNEHGMLLDPPGVLMPPRRVFRCHLHHLTPRDLPPANAPVLVYPMFMLSGRSSGERLERMLRQAYAEMPRMPELFFQPVLGASPWLAQAAAAHLQPLLSPDCGVLVVAHGSELPEAPPEPALFCRRLRELLPQNTEVQLGFFGNQLPDACAVLRSMRARHVLLLPFLLTEGIHTTRDLPTQQDAQAIGKTLQRLPVVAALLTPHEKT